MSALCHIRISSPQVTTRVVKSYGRNAKRLIEAKRHYDPDNVFFSAIPLQRKALLNELLPSELIARS